MTKNILLSNGVMKLEPKNENSLNKNEDENFLRTMGRALLASKTRDKDLMLTTMLQSAATHPDYKDDPKKAVAECVSILEGIEPKDRLEVMLSAQMIALHNLSMSTIKRASDARNQDAFNADTDRAIKLMRVFSCQLEALASYRGKGKQRITVEYTNINSGNQAFVGALDSSTNVQQMSTEGGG